jgi:hypothetical protein
MSKNKKHKSRRYRKKGGNDEQCKCCICDAKKSNQECLVPSECLIKYGKERSHKICQECWWGEFAKETASHKCPGCVRGLPIQPYPNAGKIIDLTGDD